MFWIMYGFLHWVRCHHDHQWVQLLRQHPGGEERQVRGRASPPSLHISLFQHYAHYLISEAFLPLWTALNTKPSCTLLLTKLHCWAVLRQGSWTCSVCIIYWFTINFHSGFLLWTIVFYAWSNALTLDANPALPIFITFPSARVTSVGGGSACVCVCVCVCVCEWGYYSQRVRTVQRVQQVLRVQGLPCLQRVHALHGLLRVHQHPVGPDHRGCLSVCVCVSAFVCRCMCVCVCVCVSVCMCRVWPADLQGVQRIQQIRRVQPLHARPAGRKRKGGRGRGTGQGQGLGLRLT